MSDRDVIDIIFEALGSRLADTEFTVSRMGDKVFLTTKDQKWCISLLHQVERRK